MGNFITDNEKDMLPEFVRIWQNLTKEQHYLIFGYVSGVASANHDVDADE